MNDYIIETHIVFRYLRIIDCDQCITADIADYIFQQILYFFHYALCILQCIQPALNIFYDSTSKMACTYSAYTEHYVVGNPANVFSYCYKRHRGFAELHSNGIDTFYSSTNYNFGGNWGCFTSSGGLSL